MDTLLGMAAAYEHERDEPNVFTELANHLIECEEIILYRET